MIVSQSLQLIHSFAQMGKLQVHTEPHSCAKIRRTYCQISQSVIMLEVQIHSILQVMQHLEHLKECRALLFDNQPEHVTLIDPCRETLIFTDQYTSSMRPVFV